MSNSTMQIQIQEYLCERFSLPAEQVAQMMPGFMTALCEHMENLEAALGSGDLLAIGKAGHTLKGALLNLGLAEAADLAMEIEIKGKSGDSQTDYSGLVASLHKLIEPVLATG